MKKEITLEAILAIVTAVVTAGWQIYELFKAGSSS